jgi:hypothetical protein
LRAQIAAQHNFRAAQQLGQLPQGFLSISPEIFIEILKLKYSLPSPKVPKI